MLELGKVYATVGAVEAFSETDGSDDPGTYLARHANGDWGDIDEYDGKENEFALEHGLRVLSAYRLSSGEKIWIITEADRNSTTILLPSEY